MIIHMICCSYYASYLLFTSPSLSLPRNTGDGDYGDDGDCGDGDVEDVDGDDDENDDCVGDDVKVTMPMLLNIRIWLNDCNLFQP